MNFNLDEILAQIMRISPFLYYLAQCCTWRYDEGEKKAYAQCNSQQLVVVICEPFNRLSFDEQVLTVIHELIHIAHDHSTRMAALIAYYAAKGIVLDVDAVNYVYDGAVEAYIRKLGYKLDNFVLDNMTPEEYVERKLNKLLSRKRFKNRDNAMGESEGGRVIRPRLVEVSDQQQAVTKALEFAKSVGDTHVSALIEIEVPRPVRVFQLAMQLSQSVHDAIECERTWTVQRRASDLPSVRMLGDEIVALVDVSGSMHSSEIAMLLSTIAHYGSMRVVQFDTQVVSDEIWKPGMKFIRKAIGGTRVTPALQYVMKRYQPTTIVIVSDCVYDRDDVIEAKRLIKQSGAVVNVVSDSECARVFADVAKVFVLSVEKGRKFT